MLRCLQKQLLKAQIILTKLSFITILIVFLNNLIKVESSLTLQNSFNFSGNILHIEALRNQNLIIWDQIYVGYYFVNGTPISIFQTNHNLMSNNSKRVFLKSQDQTTFIAVFGSQFACYKFKSTSTSSTQFLKYDSSIIGSQKVESGSFLNSSNQFILTTSLKNIYSFRITLNSTNPTLILSIMQFNMQNINVLLFSLRKDSNKSIIYGVDQFGSVLTISTDSSLQNYALLNTTTQLFTTGYNNTTIFPLKNGDIFVSYPVSSSSINNSVYFYDMVTQAYLIKGSYSSFNNPTTYLEFQSSLIYGDSGINLNQINLLQNIPSYSLYLSQISQLTLNLTGGGIFVSKDILQTSFFNNTFNQSFVISFQQFTSEFYIWKAVGNPLCLTLTSYCVSCDNKSLICLACQSSCILNQTNNQCQLIPTINNNSSSLPCTSNPFVPQTNCSNIICQDQNCQHCYFRSDVCNICKKIEGAILIQGICEINQLVIQIRSSSQAVSYSLSFPGLRVFISPLQPIFIWFDDYWYYIYHNRNYSKALKIVFDSIKLINNLKISPQFLDVQQLNKQMNISQTLLTSDYTSFTPLTFYQQEEKDNQFLKNTFQMYTWNYFSAIALFIIYKIIYKILTKCIKSQQQSFLGFIKAYFSENSLYKCLYLIFIEANLIFISFNSVLQFLNPCALNFNDKFNMICAIMFFFSALIFSFCFYVITYAVYYKEEASMLLTYTKGNHVKDYIAETIQLNLKNLVNGFIQSYLIYNYRLQIVSLIVVKLSLVISVFLFRKNYLNKGIFISFLFYFGFGFIFDIILFFDEENSTQFSSLVITQISILVIMSAAMILNVISVLAQSVISLFKMVKKKMDNRIKPQENQKTIKIIIQKQQNNLKDGNDQRSKQVHFSLSRKKIQLNTIRQNVQKQQKQLKSQLIKQQQNISKNKKVNKTVNTIIGLNTLKNVMVQIQQIHIDKKIENNEQKEQKKTQKAKIIKQKEKNLNQNDKNIKKNLEVLSKKKSRVKTDKSTAIKDKVLEVKKVQNQLFNFQIEKSD